MSKCEHMEMTLLWNGCLHCKVAELEAINKELEKVASYSLLKQNERLKAELEAAISWHLEEGGDNWTREDVVEEIKRRVAATIKEAGSDA